MKLQMVMSVVWLGLAIFALLTEHDVFFALGIIMSKLCLIHEVILRGE